MSRNIKFYIAIFKLFIISIFMISLDIIIIEGKSFNVPFLKDIDTFPLYGFNYIAIYLFIIMYKCMKIHNAMKKYEISDSKCVKNDDCKEGKEKTFQKYLRYYNWLMNKKCQTALNFFAICAILIFAIYLWDIPNIFILFACCSFAVGLVRLSQGISEIV